MLFQGLAWNAKKLSLPCHIIVPDHAPEAKIKPTIAMGATVTKVPFDQWWDVIVQRKFKNFTGTFIHPVSEPSVIAGNCVHFLYIFYMYDRKDRFMVWVIIIVPQTCP